MSHRLVTEAGCQAIICGKVFFRRIDLADSGPAHRSPALYIIAIIAAPRFSPSPKLFLL
jgi:hypothetical protein